MYAARTSAARAQGQAVDVIERDLTTFIERGAGVEAAVLQQIRAVLPPEVSSQIPQTRAETSGGPAAAVPVDAPRVATPQGELAPSAADAAANGAGLVSAEPGAMPTTDARAAAALAELQGAVRDVQVRA